MLEDDGPGCRRLWALIQGLPPEAATWRDKPGSWTVRDELLALLVERVDTWAAGFSSLQTKGKGRFPGPLPPIARPGEKPVPRGRVLSVSDFAAEYRQIKRGGETT